MPQFPPVPQEVKLIAHYLKVADEHDNRNIVVSYWCRMYACQTAIRMVGSPKPPEVTTLLIAIMDWLETTKKENPDMDGLTNETCAQALIEEYALQLFTYADAQDRAEIFGKNVIKAFYTCGILMDMMQQFGLLSEDFLEKRKYAKWKAAYIHNCLKCGEKPFPGPPREEDDNLEPIEDPIDNEAPKNIPTNSDSQPGPSLFVPPPNPPAAHSSEPFIPPINLPSASPLIPELPSVPTPPSSLPTFPTAEPVLKPPPTSASFPPLDQEQLEKARKYCKFAGSALNFEDIDTAVENLERALHLLQFGKEK